MTAAPLDFLAFAARALPRAFGVGLTRPELAAHLRRAEQTIAARLLIACARERLVEADLRDMSLHAAGLRLPLRRLRAFELHAPDLDACDLPDPVALLHRLLPDGPPPALARLAAELRDSAWNLALARAVADLRERTCARGQPWPAPLDPENLVVDGHPWHPMCKTRLGLRAWENLRHGPDLLAQATVYAVDVARDHAQVAGDVAGIERGMFPSTLDAGWIRLPVHAVQLRRLPRLLGPLWGTAVRPAQLPALPARALLSLRTVDIGRQHVKLSVDIHTTSARRLVSPQSIYNSPQLGFLLARIQARDPLTACGLRIQLERAAAGLHPRLGALAGQLGAIARPGLAPLARELVLASQDMSATPCPSEPVPEVIVCAALGERRPGGDLLLRELSADYPGDRRARLDAFFADYLDLLLPPLLRLLSAHGVGLEAHLQNTLLVHAGGRPRGFIVRDLGGVRLHRGRLTAAGHALELAPDSFTITGDLAEAQGKLMHTLVHAHLAALLGWIDDAGGPEPEQLWPRVRDAIDRLLRAWATSEPGLARACAEDRAFFLAEACRSKALFRMRIDERISDYAYTEVANALAAGYPPDAA